MTRCWRSFRTTNFQTSPYRVYTTLDQNLQRDAAEAVRIGMEEADQRIKHRKKRDPSYPDPQCALIALDPRPVKCGPWWEGATME